MWIKFLFSDERWVNHLGHQKWHDTYFWFSEEVAHISRSCSHCLCHWMLPFFRTSVTYKGVDVNKVFVFGWEVGLIHLGLRGLHFLGMDSHPSAFCTILNMKWISEILRLLCIGDVVCWDFEARTTYIICKVTDHTCFWRRNACSSTWATSQASTTTRNTFRVLPTILVFRTSVT